MKHNWKYKRLGDVATYVNGFAFKPSDWLEEGYPIIRIQNLNNADAEYNYSNGDVPPKYFVDPGDLLISWSASLGAYIWNGERAVLNQHIFKVVFDKADIQRNYLKYFVDHSLPILAAQTHGATMKHITKPRFDATPIPVPPMGVQERIVAELDGINEVMADCRAMLAELDRLAQSLFYATFGDPIANPHSWPVSTVGCSFKLSAGGDKPSDTTKEYSLQTPVPVFSNGIENCGLYGFCSSAKINEPSITISGRGTLGVPFIRKIPFVPIIRLIVAIPKADINLTFGYWLFKVLNFKGNGAAIPQLTVPMIKDILIPVPPLALQEQFSAQVEAIEQQKRTVEATLAEMQTLLDSRMDYWFN